MKIKSTSIVIPVKNALEYFKKCVYSIQKYTIDYELVIIDNNSNTDTKRFIENLDAIVITNNENKGFPYACNQGIKIAKYDFICFLNSDTFVTPNWLCWLQKCFEVNPDCGIASPTTCYSRGMQCDKILMDKRFKISEAEILDYSGKLKEGYIQTEIYGFCMLTKESILNKIGGFDYKRYGFGNYEEIDLQWRLGKLGYQSYWVRGAYVHHFGHKTFNEIGIDTLKNNKKMFEERKKDNNLFIENDVELIIEGKKLQ